LQDLTPRENLPAKKTRNFPIVNNTLNSYYPGIVQANTVKNQLAYKQHSNSGMAAPRIAAIKKTIGKIFILAPRKQPTSHRSSLNYAKRQA